MTEATLSRRPRDADIARLVATEGRTSTRTGQHMVNGDTRLAGLHDALPICNCLTEFDLG